MRAIIPNLRRAFSLLPFKIEKKFLNLDGNVNRFLLCLFVVCIVVIWSSTLTEKNMRLLDAVSFRCCCCCCQSTHINLNCCYLQYNVIVVDEIKLKSTVCNVAHLYRSLRSSIGFEWRQQQQRMKCIGLASIAYQIYLS